MLNNNYYNEINEMQYIFCFLKLLMLYEFILLVFLIIIKRIVENVWRHVMSYVLCCN